MDTENISEIYEKLLSLLASGDEAAAQTYLIEHYAELPEKLQGEIALATFMDAVESEVQEQTAIAEIQKEGIAAAQSLEEKLKEQQ